MKFLAVVTQPPAIYHGLSTWKKLWEDNFTSVNMKSCVRLNVGKHRGIKNGNKCIILDISSKLDCPYKRGVSSSESKNSMGIPGKGLNTSMALVNKR